MFYDKIFAAAYLTYKKHEGEGYYSAIVYVSACQMLLILLLMDLTQYAFSIDLFNWAPNKYYFLPFIIAIFILNHIYFSRQRAEQIVGDFNKLTIVKRRIWGLTAIMFFVIPLIILMFNLIPR